MRTRTLLALAAASLLAACAEPKPGSPEACRLDTVGSFTASYVEGQPRVTVLFDGAPASLIFDTGANHTVITLSAAERLKLLRNGNIRVTSQAIGGKSEPVPASIGRIEFGGAVQANRLVMVAPFDLTKFGNPPPDGLLGVDFLSEFDVELDLGTGAGTLYRPRNCPGGAPSWKLAFQSFTLVPTAPAGVIQIPILIDERPLVATLDTGAASTLITPKAARGVGASDEALASERSIVGHGVSTTEAKVIVHRFSSMHVGSEKVSNPELGVVELPSLAADVLLGRNFLRNRKLWISMSSRRIYISAVQPR